MEKQTHKTNIKNNKKYHIQIYIKIKIIHNNN
jgi:hypothetical protein